MTEQQLQNKEAKERIIWFIRDYLEISYAEFADNCQIDRAEFCNYINNGNLYVVPEKFMQKIACRYPDIYPGELVKISSMFVNGKFPSQKPSKKSLQEQIDELRKDVDKLKSTQREK